MPVSVPEAMPEFDRFGITSIMAHSEKGAAYMADAYGRVSGRVGVCGAQSVGAVNLAAGLQDGYLACSPMVALTGRLRQVRQNRHAYQEVDHMAPFEAVTKYNVPVTSIEEFPLALRQAIREATTASVQAALARLADAQRPVIVAGGGVTASRAGAELVEFAERLQLPVITSLNAKQTFPYNHPLAVGPAGQYSRPSANQTLAAADLVFFVGSHSGGQVTNEWRLPRPGTQVIQLDINPAELGRSFPITIGLQGDVRASLRKMIDQAREVPAEAAGERAKWVKHVRKLVAAWRDEVAPLVNSDELPMRPERLCKELTDLLPSNAVLVSDTGHAGIWTGAMMDLTSLDQSYIRCAGSLGWGLPAAIGAKCAAPDRPVICFTGDGGMYYHLTELDTALRYRIHTVTVVNNNASLNQEQRLNEHAYGGRTPESDRMWMLTDSDFASIADSMGCLGFRVDKPAELRCALEQALSAERPAVIDVKTHIEGIAPPAWDG